MQEDIKSYNSIYQLREAFIRSGGHSDVFAEEFNRLETPARLYFRIFFHFNTGYGLLNTGENFIDFDPTRTGYTADTNTAASYLYNNGEMQRKQMLDDFVTLLSNINTYSPWYFQSIDGLQDALRRPEYTGEFKIDEEPRSITIKTLEDAYDNRISTLLDLYKAAAFSKIQHKEILPANLRRFDMSIYIVNTPIAYVHYGYGLNSGGGVVKRSLGLDGSPARPLADANFDEVTFEIPDYREWANGSSEIFSSAKLIELRGCEIDPNSAASAYTEVKSDEPFGMSHEIKITFRDIIEQRYNDTLNRIIGDYIFMDMDIADRESKDNVWGPGAASEKFSSSDMTALAHAAYNEMQDSESDPYEYDEDGNILSVKADPEDILQSYEEQLNLMEEDNERLRKNAAVQEDAQGKITGASNIIGNENYAKNKHMSGKYDPNTLLSNTGDNANVPVLDTGNIEEKYNPGIIGGMARDFLRGAVGEAKSYLGAAITKLTMGNLYWGSLANPRLSATAGKLGSTLAHQALDKTIGKNTRSGLGSIKSALNNAKAEARGWITGSSIGSNMSNTTHRS